MNRCLICVMPDTRPDHVFVDGVCPACINYANRPEVDWDARLLQLKDLLDQHDGYPQATGFINDLKTVWQTYSAATLGLETNVPLFPMVWPGFHDASSSQISHPVIAREMSTGTKQGGTTYEQMWDAANGNTGDPAVVLLNSFNAWQHDTQIEPVADNSNIFGTSMPTTITGGVRYFPYLESFVEATAANKGNVLLGAIYEVWYDNQPPSGL